MLGPAQGGPKAALPANPDGPGSASLAGQLLVAAPSMGDPRFERTVILIVQHDPGGALGIVINKPIGETSIASVLEALAAIALRSFETIATRSGMDRARP
jgi:putative transcriptional regulator